MKLQYTRKYIMIKLGFRHVRTTKCGGPKQKCTFAPIFTFKFVNMQIYILFTSIQRYGNKYVIYIIYLYLHKLICR